MSARTASLLDDRPSPLPLFVGVSVVGHVVVVLLLIIFNWLWGAPKIDLEQKPIKASLVRLGKKREETLLPRKEEVPPPAPKTAEVAPKPTADKAVKIPDKNAKPEKEAPKKSLADMMAAASKNAKPEELEGEADGDPNGDSAVQEGERYYGLITSVIRRNYDVSNTIDENERRRLKAAVAMRIDDSGKLLDVEITQSSGNELFDSAVIGAVKKAAPFTAPPEHLRKSLKKDGVALVFTP